jgi:hypothetical protein
MRIARHILSTILIILIIILALILVAPSDAAARPPCVGKVVRQIEGIDIVQRRDGSKCTRPSSAPVTAPKRGRR